MVRKAYGNQADSISFYEREIIFDKFIEFFEDVKKGVIQANK